MNKYRMALAAMALIIGGIAIIDCNWLAGAYWLAVEIYWGILSNE